MTTINKGINDFLITFYGSKEMYVFNKAEELLTLLKTKNLYGIEKIKVFSAKDLKFKRCSKDLLKRCFDHNTELNLEHFNKSYFK